MKKANGLLFGKPHFLFLIPLKIIHCAALQTLWLCCAVFQGTVQEMHVELILRAEELINQCYHERKWMLLQYRCNNNYYLLLLISTFLTKKNKVVMKVLIERNRKQFVFLFFPTFQPGKCRKHSPCHYYTGSSICQRNYQWIKRKMCGTSFSFQKGKALLLCRTPVDWQLHISILPLGS